MARAKKKPTTTLEIDDRAVWLDPDIDPWSLTDVYPSLAAAERDWRRRVSRLPAFQDVDVRARVHAVFAAPLLLTMTDGPERRLFLRRLLAAGTAESVPCDICEEAIVPWLRRCGPCRKRLGADAPDKENVDA
jgi:hypothetical protein